MPLPIVIIETEKKLSTEEKKTLMSKALKLNQQQKQLLKRQIK